MTEAEIADEKTLVRMMALVSKGNDSNNKVNINTFFLGYEGVTTTAISSDVIQVTITDTGNIYQVDVNTAAIIGDTASTNYTLTYNANGGTGAPPAQIATIGATITLSSTEPTKEGFSFLGWSTSATATTATYTAGGWYTGNTNITLFAVWSGNQYTITYNANGGTGAPDVQTATAGESITLSTTIPTRNGYTFLGWGTTSSATSAEYEPGASYTGTTNIRLYAVWEAGSTTYTITYDAKGGTGAPNVQTATAGESITLSTTIPARTGYTFLGWATSSDATSKEYDAGGSYTGSSDVTLYAVWSIKSYTLTLNANGGSFSDGSTTSSVTKTYGTAVTLPTTANSPTRDGYTFLGWATTSTATTAAYGAGDSYTVKSTATLYAVWESTTKTYLITLNGNGGYFTTDTRTTITITVNDGESVTLTSYVPMKKLGESNAFFNGWGTSSTSTVVTYNKSATITPTKNMTLYAIWGAGSNNNINSSVMSVSKLNINHTKALLMPKIWPSIILGF